VVEEQRIELPCRQESSSGGGGRHVYPSDPHKLSLDIGHMLADASATVEGKILAAVVPMPDTPTPAR